MLELVLVPEHVEVWQDAQVGVACPLLGVLLQGFEFLLEHVDTVSFLNPNQRVQVGIFELK